MKVIADSGSTKTDWRLISATGIHAEIQTIGLNPYYASEEAFAKTLANSEIAGWPIEEVEEVLFYSAGITGAAVQAKLAGWLTGFFKNAIVEVESDLMAAARALYGSDSGMVGILGTGSNSAFYDGEKIVKHVRPLGYLLGDEGSGNALGKRLITGFLRNNLSAALNVEFKKFYPDYDNLLINLYADNRASRFLASFVPFIHRHIHDSYVIELLKEEFIKFFKILESYEGSQKLALIGSVAYYFQDIVSEIAKEEGILIVKVLKSPIESLILFHQQ